MAAIAQHRVGVATAAPDWLYQRAAATPERLALISGGQRLTYAQLDERTAQLAGQLRALGVARGDRVGVLLPNSTGYVLLIHALARLGAVLVALNTRLTAGELRYQIQHAGVSLLINDGQAAPDLLAVTPTASIDEVNAQQAEPVRSGMVEPDAVQGVMFSSGTTGRPKGILLTHGNHRASAIASAWRLGVLPGDRWLACMPLYHVGGQAIALRACLYGIAVVLHPRFDVAAVGRSLGEDGVTMVSLVPTMLHRLLEHRRAFPEGLRLVLLGGAKAPATLLERAAEAGLPVATTYGLTEACSQVATATPQQAKRKPRTVGSPLMGTSVRIVDDTGHDLPAGEVGEIVVSGPTVSPGYLGGPPHHDDWLHTGDLGYVDDDGDLFVVTRRTDLIVTGGENVYPAEVEAALEAHPGVEAACVVGVEDAEWGHRVAAAVVRCDEALAADDLIEFSRTRLAGYKAPRRITFVDALPLTASGKVSRTLVTELLGA